MYIEREAVYKMLENAQFILDGEYCGYCIEDVTISAIPAAEVAPVVRCKDCKYWHEGTGWCDKHSHFDQGDWEMFYEDDYCSCGEWKDGGDAVESV